MGKLKFEKRDHGQFAIVNADLNDVETGKWEEQYVCISGYCGPFKPDLFAAAPELLEALEVIMLHYPHQNSVYTSNAYAAIAKAKGVTNP